jgi:hypothetical protein
MMAATSSTKRRGLRLGEAVILAAVAYREWLPGAALNVSLATTWWPAEPSFRMMSMANGIREVETSTRIEFSRSARGRFALPKGDRTSVPPNEKKETNSTVAKHILSTEWSEGSARLRGQTPRGAPKHIVTAIESNAQEIKRQSVARPTESSPSDADGAGDDQP